MNRFQRFLGNPVESISEKSGMLGSLITMLMMLGVTIDVILRKFFNRPLPETDQWMGFLMVGLVYLSIAYCQKQDAQVKVDILLRIMPRKAARWLEGLTLVISLGIFSIMAWQTFLRAVNSLAINERTMGLLQMPYFPSKIVLSLGIFLFCLVLLVQLVRFMNSVFGRTGGVEARSLKNEKKER